MSSSDESYKIQNEQEQESSDSDGKAATIKGSPKSKRSLSKHNCLEPGCKAVFSRPYRLKNHIATHHEGQKLYKCDFEGCSKSYSSQSHLIRHKKITHTDEECAVSDEVLCNFEGCNMVCSNKYNLKKHIKCIHIDLPYECSICKKKFRRKSHLHQHRVEEHNEAAPYKCSKCSRSFIHFHLYQQHISRHKSYKCDCNTSFDKWSLYLKHKSDCSFPKTSHVCAICQKTFTNKFNLTQHSLVHLQESQIETFPCPYVDCQRSYKYKKNLTWHVKTHHKKVVEYCECTEKDCGAVLKSKRSLKHHLQVKHAEKPLKVKARRKPRKDKGVKKVSAAVELSGFNPSQNVNESIEESKEECIKEPSVGVQSGILQNCEEINVMIINLPEEHKKDETLNATTHLGDFISC